MSSHSVTILDYGMCNLLNVARAFEHIGAQVSVSDDPHAVLAADRLVVPGVGAFRDSMNELSERGFADAMRQFAEFERPMFGICVGMQILFEGSDEFGNHAGLGILPGRVQEVPNLCVDALPQRVPHIGWNNLDTPTTGRDWQGTILEPLVRMPTAVYFVHSFSAHPTDEHDVLAECIYGGHRLCAAVQRGNLVATQFHPERSGEVGLSVARRFIEL